MTILFIGTLAIIVLSIILYLIHKEDLKSKADRMARGEVEKYWNGAERRRHVRFDASIKVRYTLKRSSPDGDAVSRDISEGGIRLLVDKKLERGTILNLRIANGPQAQPISLEGVIVWCNEARDKKDSDGRRLFHIGVKLTRIEKGSRDIFYGMIRSFEERLNTTTAPDGLAVSA